MGVWAEGGGRLASGHSTWHDSPAVGLSTRGCHTDLSWGRGGGWWSLDMVSWSRRRGPGHGELVKEERAWTW